MVDLTGWTGPVRAGSFRFGARDPGHPFAHLTDQELEARSLAALPGAVAAWRSGPDRERVGRILRRTAGAGVPLERLERYPAMLAHREALGALLTPLELRELGVAP